MSSFPRPPLVTVLVTVYKRIEYLPDALRSLQTQTFRDFEVLVKDDSGCALAREITQAMAGSLAIRYLPNERTLGIAASLRAGLEAARGKYIAILNDDDLWAAGFLEPLVRALEEDPCRVLAFSDHWVINADGSVDGPRTEANTRRYARSGRNEGDLSNPVDFVLRQNGVPLAMAAIFRKDALDPALLVDEVSGAYDLWISCLLAASGRAFYYTPQRLTYYRLHEQMETARISPDKNANHVFIFSELLNRNLFPTMRSFLQARRGDALFRLGRDQLYFNHTGESRRLFWKAFASSPNWRPLAAYALSWMPQVLRARLRLSMKNGS